MIDYLNIGCAPAEENCVQVGSPDYLRCARIECEHFISAIIKKLGEPPLGAALRIKAFPHDFGTYFEVVCTFDTNNKDAMDYALRCEACPPSTWAEVGMSAPKF